MANKDRKGRKVKTESAGVGLEEPWWTEDKEFESWLEAEPTTEFDTDENYFVPIPSPIDGSRRRRLDQIKENYSLLSQFSPTELQILMNLKRNTSPKSWTLREDLVVLTFSTNNSEMTHILQARNKEAVKKRLQLLRSKGLMKRRSPPGGSPEASEQEENSC